jgi:hypothetical protein
MWIKPKALRAQVVLVGVLSCIVLVPASAQWSYRAPNAPRGRDGKANLAAPPPRTSVGLIDLSGVWQPNPKFNTNLAADLKADAVPMLPWAQVLYQHRQDNLGKDDPEGLCLPPGVPRASGVPFPSKIVQTPTELVILYETRTTFRQIFLDTHAVVKDPQPTWMGYSTGKWEGDTLVVKTSHFNEKTWLDDDGHPHSDALRVTERFRRPDFGHLFIDISIDDVKAYAHPWTVTEDFLLEADGELLEYVCNENNLDPPHLVGK